MKHGLNKADESQETSLKLNEAVQTYLMANFRGILNEATIEHIGNMVADLLDDLNSTNAFADHRVQGSGESKEQYYAKIVAATGVNPSYLPEWCKKMAANTETLMLIGEAMGWRREQMQNQGFHLRESFLTRIQWLEEESSAKPETLSPQTNVVN